MAGGGEPCATLDPWYRDGLRFDCTGCGTCCAGEPGTVAVSGEEIRAIAECLGEDAAQTTRLYVRVRGGRRVLYEWPDGDCVFLEPESRGCRVYEARPRQCRTWPFWAQNLTGPRAWERAAEECPGCDSGRLHSGAEIRALLEEGEPSR